MANVLIAYVTKTGSTEKAARLIASRLEENGYYTTVLPIDKAGDLETYDDVIIGGPINGMSWHQDAAAFVTANAEKLKSRNVSFFCLSYIYKTGSAFWRKQISKAFNASSAIVKPEMTGIFGGVIENPMPAPIRFIFGTKKDAPADQQDDGAVLEWAEKWIEAGRS